jgi:hypothetical protein
MAILDWLFVNARVTPVVPLGSVSNIMHSQKKSPQKKTPIFDKIDFLGADRDHSSITVLYYYPREGHQAERKDEG